MNRTVRSNWQSAILVCGRCSKRQHGGFGKKGKTSLAKLLRGAGVADRGRKAEVGLIETGCLKLCPKRAVVAVNTAAPERWVLIPPGTPLDEIVPQLLPGQIAGEAPSTDCNLGVIPVDDGRHDAPDGPALFS